VAESEIEGRLVVNETLFREANDRMRRLYELSDAAPEENEFVCECGSARCTETIRMSIDEYEAVRRDGRYFVAFGHAAPDRVVAVGVRYLVVEGRDA
jgi:hypothetical protein